MFVYYKGYILIGLTFLKEMMLIKQVYQKSVMFFIVGISSIKVSTNVCNRRHDLLMMSMNLSDVAILNIKSSDYCCISSRISKNMAVNLMQNADLTKKAEHYKT